MERINADHNSIGRILADNIYDSRGRLLLSSKTVISPPILQVLHSRHILVITVHAKENSANPENSATQIPDYLSEWDPDFLSAKTLKIINTRQNRKKSDNFLPCSGIQNKEIPAFSRISVEEILEQTGLFTLPEVYYHITELLASPTASAREIAEAVSADTAFTIRLLQVANSSLYSLNKRIVSVTEAISYIGLDQLAVLSIGIAFTRSLQTITLESSSMQNFWVHSISTGIAAKLLAEYCNKKNSEVFFIAGLLHDLGKMLEYNAIPGSALYLHLQCRKEKKEQQNIEHELLGYDHAAVSFSFLKKYSLPQELQDLIKGHHQPEISANPDNARIIHLADIVSNALGLGSSGQYLVPQPRSIDKDLFNQHASSFLQTATSRITEFTREMIHILFNEQASSFIL